jgi:hypothetical protein
MKLHNFVKKGMNETTNTQTGKPMALALHFAEQQKA